jgi:hypothetical protein
MGWIRHYHAYKFTDKREGACIGPTSSTAVDVMHIWKDGFAFIDDTEVKLGQILQNVGDKMGYVYDLGDHWRHVITVEEILPAEQSTGECICLDGKRWYNPIIHE